MAALEVGRIGKAHGVRGEVLVTFTSDRPERHQPGAVLRVQDQVLTVASARPHQGKMLVKFAEFGDRNEAEAFRGELLFGEPLEVSDGTVFVHDVVGARVVDVSGVERGEVVEVLANPASDLLVLDSEALVPFRFVVDGPVDGVLTVDAPDGLFDLGDDEDDDEVGDRNED